MCVCVCVCVCVVSELWNKWTTTSCARKAFACACVVPPLFSMISLIPGHDTNIPEVVTPGVENEEELKEEEDVILAANTK